MTEPEEPLFCSECHMAVGKEMVWKSGRITDGIDEWVWTGFYVHCHDDTLLCPIVNDEGKWAMSTPVRESEIDRTPPEDDEEFPPEDPDYDAYLHMQADNIRHGGI